MSFINEVMDIEIECRNNSQGYVFKEKVSKEAIERLILKGYKVEHQKKSWFRNKKAGVVIIDEERHWTKGEGFYIPGV